MSEFDYPEMRVPRGRLAKMSMCDERTAKRVRAIVQQLKDGHIDDLEQFVLQAFTISGSWIQRLDWFEAQVEKAIQARTTKEDSSERPS